MCRCRDTQRFKCTLIQRDKDPRGEEVEKWSKVRDRELKRKKE